MSQAEKVEKKVAKELAWLRAAHKTNGPDVFLRSPGDFIFDAKVIADRIATQLRADPDAVLALVMTVLDADPTVRQYTERYGTTLRPLYRKYHYVILEE